MEQKLKGILSSIFEVKEEDINDLSSMETVETWDSIKHIELVLSIEENFDVAFSVDEIVEMVNYPAIKDALLEKGIEL